MHQFPVSPDPARALSAFGARPEGAIMAPAGISTGGASGASSPVSIQPAAAPTRPSVERVSLPASARADTPDGGVSTASPQPLYRRILEARLSPPEAAHAFYRRQQQLAFMADLRRQTIERRQQREAVMMRLTVATGLIVAVIATLSMKTF